MEQLPLYSDAQMKSLLRPKLRKSKPGDTRVKVVKPEIAQGDVGYHAIVDCLRSAGYRGNDPVYDFLIGNHP
jgi:hypothetical protein